MAKQTKKRRPPKPYRSKWLSAGCSPSFVDEDEGYTVPDTVCVGDCCFEDPKEVERFIKWLTKANEWLKGGG